MNKELIKKYKAEFDHLLYGGKLQVKFVNDPWEEAPEGIFSYSTVNFVLVIEDEYVEFRRALAEGKVIQYYECVYQEEMCVNLDRYDWLDWKSATPSSSFTKSLNYRVKPEEPKFKVGAWVKIIRFRNHVPVTIKNIEGCRYILSTGLYADDSILEHWKPQLGEWCWFWNFDEMPRLEQFNKQHDLYIHLGNYETLTNKLYEHCEPFIGQLPTSNIKEYKKG